MAQNGSHIKGVLCVPPLQSFTLFHHPSLPPFLHSSLYPSIPPSFAVNTKTNAVLRGTCHSERHFGTWLRRVRNHKLSERPSITDPLPPSIPQPPARPQLSGAAVQKAAPVQGLASKPRGFSLFLPPQSYSNSHIILHFMWYSKRERKREKEYEREREEERERAL